MSERSSSRASPLPQVTEFFRRTAVECGSGLAREGGLADNCSDRASRPPSFAVASRQCLTEVPYADSPRPT
ncbi:hypothetical protein C5612_15465 [Pseudomonas frederiksbergensis]|uniref:Uncharacterized protein n=1 Tax=Pseudomonas frederiksbergensis TaxID=104087 RepID=A0A2S8HL69_9PSED|nr:hypothetical protein C5612_15465 [Pseudomonas frederiksbergensis]